MPPRRSATAAAAWRGYPLRMPVGVIPRTALGMSFFSVESATRIATNGAVAQAAIHAAMCIGSAKSRAWPDEGQGRSGRS
jgi:hypothetical protein